MPTRRIVLKFSGKMFDSDSGLQTLADVLRSLCKTMEVVLVPGGGNLHRRERGRSRIAGDRSPLAAEHRSNCVGMLATVANAFWLVDALDLVGMTYGALSKLPIKTLIPDYTVEQAKQLLAQRHLLIVCGDTGQPGVSTDTAAVLMAYELGVETVYKGTNVPGIFPLDTEGRPQIGAPVINELTGTQFLAGGFHTILDPCAVALARDHRIALQVFESCRLCSDAIVRSITNNVTGTTIKPV